MAKIAFVAEIEVAAGVDGAGSGDVKNTSERSGRNPFIP